MRRFLYYWRIPIYFFVLFFVLLFICVNLEGDAAGIVGAIWFFDIMLFAISFLYSLYSSIKSLINYIRTGDREEYFEFAEIEFIKNVWFWITSEAGTFSDLSIRLKARYLFFRLLSVVLIVIGCIGCFAFYPRMFLVVIFTLVIIGGATLWILANPKTYNDKVSGVRSILCSADLDEETLYEYLKAIQTPLGTPILTDVTGFKKPVIVYGASYSDFAYVVYKSKNPEILLVSAIAPMYVTGYLPEPEEILHEIKDAANGQYDYIDEIAEAVEKAAECALDD